MSDDVINFEVDGQPMQGKKGQMIMEVTDHEGTYIPRFCYHKKLSIAANCRMCLVEVEKAPKPLPACATPIGDGMKVFTKSPKAIAAQRATMEFLLINHPLDCPICDQGGECELQDLAMGFGRDISRYYDGKRSVKDQDIGPLISTDMTRCIHCTRCVRFGEEICGYQQLGTIGRGEWMKISTYIAQTIDHELSANIIDVCPVGALNNKPYRYSARAWEMMQHATISPHDCVGSNMYVHSLRGTIKRVVPKENEAINETWLSDRDRFSYEGVYSDDRLLVPQLKSAGVGGTWLAMSRVYGGAPVAAMDRDLDGLEFSDAPWVIGQVSGLPSREELAASLRGVQGQALRLFAFGIDAYRLLGYIDWLNRHPYSFINGATGELSIDASRQVRRKLAWARFQDGIPIAVEGALQFEERY